ncbi:MAG TPA: prephenate dehydrogenase/arogenate dehydrogenase family protein [Actinomycetota bacterium]
MASGHVAILGTGLIGGSVGLALRAADPALPIIGYDPAPGEAERAVARGAASAAAPSAHAAAEGARMVVLAMPVDRMPEVCRSLEAVVGSDAVVTDVGSAKAGVVAQGEASFGDRFVGGHPMAGSERHGIDAADDALFEGAWWILTPTSRTSSTAYSRVLELVARAGGKPIAIDPSTHDVLLARLSHLPQIASSAIVEVAVASGDRETLLGLAGNGFRDVTRIAASNPDLWVAIIKSNRASVLEALDGLGDRLRRVAELVREESWDELARWLDGARRARLELFAKPHYTGEPVGLSMLIPDRPGVLAEVTTAAGKLGANIEDLRIVHSTEGGRGRLELVVAGREPADRLSDMLQEIGYHVTTGTVD